MDCENTQMLMHAYMDGELDLSNSLEVERHLQGCAVCSQEYEGHQVVRSALEAGAFYYRAPAGLQKHVRAALHDAERAGVPRRQAPWAFAAVAAALVLVAIVAWGLGSRSYAPAGSLPLAQEVVAGHTRSLMAEHLTDVTSTDKHTVKPWFAGKLDFSPTVNDFAAQGYPLIGGRLDYLDNRPVAALVYQRQRHVINLFTWPADSAPGTAARTLTRQGYNIVYWNQGGMTYWAVSDLNSAELQDFVQLVQHASG